MSSSLFSTMRNVLCDSEYGFAHAVSGLIPFLCFRDGGAFLGFSAER